MAKHKLSIREQSKLLVQSILNKQTLSANKILQKLIAQAQLARENAIQKLISQQDQLDDEDTDLDEGNDDLEDDAEDTGDDEDSDESEEDGGQDQADESQIDNKVDDALQIQCEINAKRITAMFDTIAALKQALDEKGLDVNSKEYIKSEVSIQYYSDKLQEFQGKTNPGVDQSKLEEALDKIFDALEQLKGQLGVDESSDVDTAVESPEEAAGEESEEESDEGEEAEEQEDEDLESDEEAESDEQDLEEQQEQQEI